VPTPDGGAGSTGSGSQRAPASASVPAHELQWRQLLNDVVSGGLRVEYAYTRRPSAYGDRHVVMALRFENVGAQALTDIKVAEKPKEVIAFTPINHLAPRATESVTMNVEFTSPSTPVQFHLGHSGRSFKVSIKPSVGELMNPARDMELGEFTVQQRRLSGMHASTIRAPIDPSCDVPAFVAKTIAVHAVAIDKENGVYNFAARCTIRRTLVLVSVEVAGDGGKILVNCDDTVVNTLVTNLLKSTFA